MDCAELLPKIAVAPVPELEWLELLELLEWLEDLELLDEEVAT